MKSSVIVRTIFVNHRDDLWSIGELARRAGIAPSALRFYESRGLLDSHRSGGGQRLYPRAALRRLAFVRAAQAVGVTLEQIQLALSSLPERRTPNAADWQRLAKGWQPMLEGRIDLLTRLRDQLGSCIGCGCLSLTCCKLYNPQDVAAIRGSGPRYLMGDRAGPVDRTNRTNRTDGTDVAARDGAAVILREPRPGDLGWVVHRHAAIYASEHGFDSSFEGMVAGIVARFVADFVPGRERAWIAERDGAIVGSVFVVRKNAATAQLRLLYLEPSARGLGVGRRLVAECLRFAEAAGYRRITLSTHSILLPARRLYEAAGFTLESTTPHRSFGRDLEEEIWWREL